MADELAYADLDPLSTNERQSYLRVVGKKNAVKLPGGQYYFNLDEQVFQPYAVKLQEEVNDWFRTVGEPPKQADYLANSDLKYYSSYDPSTFEGWVAKTIQTGGYVDGSTNKFVPVKTPGDINKMVDKAWQNGQFEFTDTDPLRYQSFAKGLWQEAEKAVYDFNKDYTEYSNKVSTIQDPYTSRGLPSPELRYDPTKFDNYRKYEQAQIAKARQVLGTTKETPTEKRFVQELRKNAAEYYASKGRTPYYDALIRLEANK
jgi:hypothetical protein